VAVDAAYLFLQVSLVQCLTSLVMGQFTIPFPSHRTFSFPESGGPTVFVTQHARTDADTRRLGSRCR
jgi:hypothetical protein